jgi:hypothetical protein
LDEVDVIEKGRHFRALARVSTVFKRYRQRHRRRLALEDAPPKLKRHERVDNIDYCNDFQSNNFTYCKVQRSKRRRQTNPHTPYNQFRTSKVTSAENAVTAYK